MELPESVDMDSDLLKSLAEELFGDVSVSDLLQGANGKHEDPTESGDDWMLVDSSPSSSLEDSELTLVVPVADVLPKLELFDDEELVDRIDTKPEPVAITASLSAPLKISSTLPGSPYSTSSGSISSPPKCHGNVAQDCKVCGRPGSGTKSAFGGRSCTSCRAFFLRAVQSGRAHSYSCATEDCQIDSRSWKSCQRCRFKRCVDRAGMREELVANKNGASSHNRQIKGPAKNRACGFSEGVSTSTGSSPIEHQRRTQPEIKAPSETASTSLVPVEPPNIPFLHTPSDRFTLEESLLIKGLHSFMADSVAKIYLAMGQLRVDFIENMAKCLTKGGTYGWHNLVLLTKTMVSVSPMFYRSLGDMQFLDQADQAQLLQKNFPLVMELTLSGIIESQANTNRHFNRLIRKAFTEREDIANLLRTYNITPDTYLRAVQYSQLYHQRDCQMNYESLVRHRELVLTLGQWTLQDPHDPEKRSDEVLSTLISMITIFSGAGLDLKRPKVVDDIQKKYSHMLYRYFKERFHDSCLSKHRFYLGMAAVDLAREAVNLKMAVMPQIKVGNIPMDRHSSLIGKLVA